MWSAATTTPMPPTPRTFSTRYFPARMSPGLTGDGGAPIQRILLSSRNVSPFQHDRNVERLLDRRLDQPCACDHLGDHLLALGRGVRVLPIVKPVADLGALLPQRL